MAVPVNLAFKLLLQGENSQNLFGLQREETLSLLHSVAAASLCHVPMRELIHTNCRGEHHLQCTATSALLCDVATMARGGEGAAQPSPMRCSECSSHSLCHCDPL